MCDVSLYSISSTEYPRFPLFATSLSRGLRERSFLEELGLLLLGLIEVFTEYRTRELKYHSWYEFIMHYAKVWVFNL